MPSGQFLDGEFPAPFALNVDMLRTLAPDGGSGITRDALSSTLNNYDGFETKSAGYAMANLSLGDKISIVPGVRYQNLTTHYTGYPRDGSVPRRAGEGYHGIRPARALAADGPCALPAHRVAADARGVHEHAGVFGLQHPVAPVYDLPGRSDHVQQLSPSSR